MRLSLDVVEVGEQADVPEPLVRVLEREPRAVGQRGGDRLETAGGRSREEAARLVGDGDVHQAADGDVERRTGRPGQRPEHAERREVDALDLQSRGVTRCMEALDRLAPDRDHDDASPRAGCGLDLAERVEVQHGLVDRHRNVVGRDASDLRIERLGRRHDRQLQRSRDDALVGDAEAHAGGQLVLGEERPQLRGQLHRVGGVAIAEDARGQLGHGSTGERNGAVRAGDGGGDVAGVELEPDDGGWGLLSPEHVPVIGRRAPRP